MIIYSGREEDPALCGNVSRASRTDIGKLDFLLQHSFFYIRNEG
mgnify:CR=1 FL=1